MSDERNQKSGVRCYDGSPCVTGACAEPCKHTPDENVTSGSEGDELQLAIIERDVAAFRAREAELKHALMVVLPMAKGYAHEHPVGDNIGKCEWAEGLLHGESHATGGSGDCPYCATEQARGRGCTGDCKRHAQDKAP